MLHGVLGSKTNNKNKTSGSMIKSIPSDNASSAQGALKLSGCLSGQSILRSCVGDDLVMAKDRSRETQLGLGPDGSGIDSALDDASATAGGLPLRSSLQSVALPDALERTNQVSHHLVGVARGRGDAKALLTAGNGGVVDTLDIDAVGAEELIRSGLADLGITHQNGNNVGRVGDDGDIKGSKLSLESAGIGLLGNALVGRVAEVLDGGSRTSDNGWGQGGGKDESRGVGANHVNQGGRTGNIATNNTKGFSKGSGDDVDLIHSSLHGTVLGSVQVVSKVQVLGDTGTVRAVHANGMNLVEEGDGAILFGKAANVVDLADGARHRVDGLKGNDFRDGGIEGLEKLLEMSGVVVAEDHLFDAGVFDALDHGSVVHGVGEDNTVGQLLGEGAKGGVVGDIAGGEDEGGGFVVEGGEFVFESEMHGTVTGDVAGTSGAGAVLAEGRLHGFDDDGVL